jgi:hypothetical protein
MRKRPRESLRAPEALDAILHRAGESRFARDRPPFEPSVWRDAVGARIADRAQPVSLRDGVLVLRVPSSVWAHELSLLATALCQRLRERGIEALELRFRVGDPVVIPKRPVPRAIRAVPAVKPLPVELARALGNMEDSDLRDVIARAAAANLAAQALREPPGNVRISEARRAARAPRDAAEGTCPPGRTSRSDREPSPRTPGGARGRSR